LGEPAQGESSECRDVTDGARPRVVDRKPEQRGDLEVAMSQGIAVMAYDYHKMDLLPDCTVEGSYGFKGVVLKQQLIRLEDKDEIRANLPLNRDGSRRTHKRTRGKRGHFPFGGGGLAAFVE
jgi:hypothetical protein